MQIGDEPGTGEEIFWDGIIIVVHSIARPHAQTCRLGMHLRLQRKELGRMNRSKLRNSILIAEMQVGMDLGLQREEFGGADHSTLNSATPCDDVQTANRPWTAEARVWKGGSQ